VTADDLVAAVGTLIAQFCLSLGSPDHRPERIVSGSSTGTSEVRVRQPSRRPPGGRRLINALD